MPLTQFICPDGQRIDTQQCISACRMPRRCLSRATLAYLAKDRIWDGTPHVTNLLNGTMLEWLKINRDYAIRPQDNAFALLGSSHHKLLEVDEGAEIHLNHGWIQGTLDLVEHESDGLVLTDYKTYGSYRVARLLGIVKENKQFRVDSDIIDDHSERMQLNMYRIMYETHTGRSIARMQLQVTVRDGGLQAAWSRGVMGKMYMVPIAIMPDADVEKVFLLKAAALQSALGSTPVDYCTDEERWHDNRCKGYCPVNEYCGYGRAL